MKNLSRARELHLQLAIMVEIFDFDSPLIVHRGDDLDIAVAILDLVDIGLSRNRKAEIALDYLSWTRDSLPMQDAETLIRYAAGNSLIPMGVRDQEWEYIDELIHQEVLISMMRD